MKFNIAIRADGGQRVGMGHLVRCLSLAHELRLLGCEVFFISCHDTGLELLHRQGFKVKLLPECRDRSQEVLMISNIINNEKADALVIDTYNVDTRYFDALQRDIYPLIYIDDLNGCHCPADIVVNGNVNAADLGYEPTKPEQILLLGAEHNLLRRQYCHLPNRRVNDDVSDIMLTTGGSDPHNLVPQFTDWLMGLDNNHLHIVVGKGFTNVDVICEQQQAHRERIKIYQNLDDLSALMLRVDLAISSGGSTLYELGACGTPTLAFIMADNQAGIVTWLAQKGYIDSLGWHHSVTGDQLRDRVMKLANDQAKRQVMADQGQALFDGYGASRVAREVISLVKKRGSTTK